MPSTFEKMLRVKLMNGASQAEVASGIGVPLLVARKYINSAKGFSEDVASLDAKASCGD